MVAPRIQRIVQKFDDFIHLFYSAKTHFGREMRPHCPYVPLPITRVTGDGILGSSTPLMLVLRDGAALAMDGKLVEVN